MIIDATDLILGRIGTVAAKKALLGENIHVVNCEKAIMTGAKKTTIARYRQFLAMGQPQKGPFVKRRPDMFVRRTIRGMLPYKQEKGRKAFEKIKCYLGVPENLKDKKIETIKKADMSKLPVLKYITIGNLCKEIGKWRK